MDSQTPLDEIVALAQDLIKIRSTAQNNTALNEAVILTEQKLKDFSLRTFSSNGKPSLLIHNAKHDTKHFKIIFNAHIDVVNGNESQFVPHVIGNRLYG